MEGVDAQTSVQPVRVAHHLYVLLDCSGSMLNQEPEVVEGTNSALDAIYALQKEGETVEVEIYTFNTTATVLVPSCTLSKQAPRLECSQLRVGGNTALYDVVGEVLCKCPHGSTLLIATDGADTDSREYTADGIAAFIDRCKEQKDVRFVFVGAGGGAHMEASKMGLCEYECTRVNDNQSLGTALSSQPVVESLSQALAGMAGDAGSSKRKKIKVADPSEIDIIEIYSQEYD